MSAVPAKAEEEEELLVTATAEEVVEEEDPFRFFPSTPPSMEAVLF